MNIKTNNSLRALTLIEVLVVVAVVLVLAGVLLPALAKSKAKSSRAGCQNNLKQIGLAVRTWEGDYDDRYPMAVPVRDGGSQGSPDASRSFLVLSNWLSNPKILTCPNDIRPPADSYESLANSNLSYFAGLDADDCFPVMPLAGDRNLVTNGVAVGPGLAVIQKKTLLGWSTAMHHWSGNLCLADGSVSHLDAKGLNDALAKTTLALNRLAMP